MECIKENHLLKNGCISSLVHINNEFFLSWIGNLTDKH